MTPPSHQTLEREIKLGVGRKFCLPELPGEPFAPRTFISTYYDTKDYGLARSGITLRYRREAGRGVWQLKLPRGGARVELEFEGGSRYPPVPVTTLLVAHVRGQQLKPVARLRTERKGIKVVHDGAPVADVVLDSVAVLDGARVIRRLDELEIERTGGSEKDLLRIEKILREAGAQEVDQRPKVFRVLGLPLPAPGDRVPPDAQPVEHVKAVLELEAARLLRHDPGARLGTDAEDLHQMRVATRRLRAYLRAAAPFLDPHWAEPIRRELGWLGTVLGRVRDLDVLLDYLRKESAALRASERRAFQPVMAVLQRERAEARSLLLRALTSDRYLALLDGLATAAQPAVVTEAAATLKDIAWDEYRKLRRAMRKLGPKTSGKRLHEIRIKGKRARYATELAEASIGKPATRVLQQAKAFQDLLGEHQDAIVCEQRLRKLLRRPRSHSAAPSLGRLIERQSERRLKARAALPNVWDKLERRAEKVWG